MDRDFLQVLVQSEKNTGITAFVEVVMCILSQIERSKALIGKSTIKITTPVVFCSADFWLFLCLSVFNTGKIS